MRLEDALLKKTRPKFGSKRYNVLRSGIDRAFDKCEKCGALLLNPQSILIHQGKQCQQTFMEESKNEKR